MLESLAEQELVATYRNVLQGRKSPGTTNLKPAVYRKATHRMPIALLQRFHYSCVHRQALDCATGGYLRLHPPGGSSEPPCLQDLWETFAIPTRGYVQRPLITAFNTIVPSAARAPMNVAVRALRHNTCLSIRSVTTALDKGALDGFSVPMELTFRFVAIRPFPCLHTSAFDELLPPGLNPYAKDQYVVCPKTGLKISVK